MPSLEERIKGLPPDLRREVEDFVDFLIDRRAPHQRGNMKFAWEGALADLRDQYTSVDLQHKIFEYGEGEKSKRLPG
ncbi:MAG: hypothetical protein NTNFB02_20070 [Nitrospira sp.]